MSPAAATHNNNNNTNTKQPPSKFTITALPTTDIWLAPPSTRRFNAPLAHTSRGPLATFSRAGLSLALPFPSPSAGRLVPYDQGGLVLGISRRSGAGGGDDGEQVVNGGGDGWLPPPRWWLKAGIEMFEGEPWLSVVGCDRWSDVSMVPLGWGSRGGGGDSEGKEERPTARVEVERATEKDALRVYWIVPAAADEAGEEKRVLIREANWFFAPEGGEEEGWDVSVAAYAARPLRNEKDVDEVLEVDFERFEVEWL